MKLSRLIALLGSIFTLLQIYFLANDKEGICLNDGCKIVDSLTSIPPLYINIAGFVFFQLIFWGMWFAGNNKRVRNYVDLLLLAGFAAEGVLVAFQQFVAQSFCSYCLIIFGLILSLNILAGLPQFLRGATVFIAVLIGFISLQFDYIKGSPLQGLDNGTFALLQGDSREQRYLFFSSTCKYCEKVIESLNEDNTCGMRFNPIDTITDFNHPTAQRMEVYDTNVNKQLLRSFGINQIPVLLITSEYGVQVVKGAGPIEQYLSNNCLLKQENIESSDLQSNPTNQNFDFLSPTDESCAVESDCEDLPILQQPLE